IDRGAVLRAVERLLADIGNGRRQNVDPAAIVDDAEIIGAVNVGELNLAARARPVIDADIAAGRIHIAVDMGRIDQRGREIDAVPDEPGRRAGGDRLSDRRADEHGERAGRQWQAFATHDSLPSMVWLVLDPASLRAGNFTT